MLYKRLIWLIWRHLYPGFLIYLKNIFISWLSRPLNCRNGRPKKEKITSFPCFVCPEKFRPCCDFRGKSACLLWFSRQRGCFWISASNFSLSQAEDSLARISASASIHNQQSIRCRGPPSSGRLGPRRQIWKGRLHKVSSQIVNFLR